MKYLLTTLLCVLMFMMFATGCTMTKAARTNLTADVEAGKCYVTYHARADKKGNRIHWHGYSCNDGRVYVCPLDYSYPKCISPDPKVTDAACDHLEECYDSSELKSGELEDNFICRKYNRQYCFR